MPLSANAFEALRAVVEWNPSTARFLFYLLRDTPHLVKYKDDLYGPLTLILIDDVIRKPIFHNISAPSNRHTFPILDDMSMLVKLPPFPREKLCDCKVFGDEWKQRELTKQEFADALEQILSELP